MKSIDLLSISTAACVAGYAAIALDYVAHSDLGLSSEQIRRVALGAAMTIAALLVIDFFSRKRRRIE